MAPGEVSLSEDYIYSYKICWLCHLYSVYAQESVFKNASYILGEAHMLKLSQL